MEIEYIADKIYQIAEDTYWDIREGYIDNANDNLKKIKDLVQDIRTNLK